MLPTYCLYSLSLSLISPHPFFCYHQEGTGPYCSAGCQSDEAPSPSVLTPFHLDSPSEFYHGGNEDNESIYHQFQAAPKSRWAGNDSAGIIAWATDIPSGAPAGAPSPDEGIFNPSPTPLPAFRPPKLLIPHQRPVPPTLCMSTPPPTRSYPSLPIVTPQQQMSSLSLGHSYDIGSADKTSLLSGVTESFIATPSSAGPVPISPHHHQPSIFCALATHVRSWVSRSPQPQPKQTSLHVKQRFSPTPPTPNKLVDSMNFTIVAKTRHSRPLHFISSPRSSLDDLSDDDLSPAWWVSSTTMVDTGSKVASSESEKKQLGQLPRGRHPILQLPLGVSDDHPAYRSRGRKPSRAAA